VLRVVHLLVQTPKVGATDPEVFPDCRLVPKHTILYLVGLYCIVQHETFIVFCACVHHFTEHIERGKDAKEGFVQLFSILDDVFPEDEDIVDVCAEGWGEVHHILHRQHEENLPVTTIHETLTNARILQEL